MEVVSERTGRHAKGIGQMCALVITVIAPFSPSNQREMAGQHHLDMHTSTSMAITRHGKVSGGRQTAAGGETQKSWSCLSVVCVCVFVTIPIS